MQRSVVKPVTSLPQNWWSGKISSNFIAGRMRSLFPCKSFSTARKIGCWTQQFQPERSRYPAITVVAAITTTIPIAVMIAVAWLHVNPSLQPEEWVVGRSSSSQSESRYPAVSVVAVITSAITVAMLSSDPT